jgi:hypothetical protein
MFKEIIQGLGSKNKERKERFHEIDEEDRLHTIVEDRKKSSNERELERYLKEEREKKIKEQLEIVRKKRDAEINYLHNPINAKNITNHSDFNLLKEKKLFSDNKNMFAHNSSVLSRGNLGLCH